MSIIVGHGIEDEEFQIAESVDPNEYMDDYPDDLDLRPTSELHKKLIKAIIGRARESHSHISKRYPYWRQIDRTLTSFVNLSEDEIETKSKDDRKPMSVVIPITSATLETILTYFTATFLESPQFRYGEVEPGDKIKAALLEHIIDKQVIQAKMGLARYTSWRSAISYGFGVLAPEWVTIKAFRTKKTPIRTLINSVNRFLDLGMEEQQEEVIRYEGNELNSIDSYKFLPDPNFSVHNVQKMRYVGWIDRGDYMSLLEEEQSESDLFNVKFLGKAKHSGMSFIFNQDDSSREDRLGGKSRSTSYSHPIDVINMFVKLVPSQWGLGDSDKVEKWLFSVASDSIIIKAKPLGLDHNMFPLVVCAPDFDGFSTSPTSILERIYPLQETVDFYLSSHIANTRKAINDMLVYDPYMVNSCDLRNPEPGKLIRLRKAVWGRGVKDAVQQLHVNDVTRGHVEDAMFLISIIQMVSGTDVAQTVRRKTSERVSSAEARNDIQSAVGKMAKMAKISAMQCDQDLAYMLASHTIQLMSKNTWVSTVGRLGNDFAAEYGERVSVTPADIDIDFDILSHDGTAPGNENPNVIGQIFQTLVQNPELAQGFDMFRIFTALAKSSGFKSVHDFIKKGPNVNVQTASPEVLDEQARQGNAVPVSEFVNQNGGTI